MSEVSLHEELKKTKKELKQESVIFESSSPVLLLAETNEVRETEALRAMGLVPEVEESLVERGKQVVRKNLEDKFDTLFSATEVKELCLKYGLKFLPTRNYKGPIKDDFGSKIIEFNESHGVDSTVSDHEAQKYRILAPHESFGKSSSDDRKNNVSMDPILFYQVEDGDRGTSSDNDHKREKYYTIVYEWGNKFNIWRMITSYRRRNTESNLIHTFFLFFALGMISCGFIGLESLNAAIGLSTGVSIVISIIKMAAFTGSNDDFGNRLIARSWNKENY